MGSMFRFWQGLTPDQKKALSKGVIASVLGLIIQAIWPWMQQTVGGENIPTQVYEMCGEVALWAIYLSVAFMVTGILPAGHWIRVTTYTAGVCAFFINLLQDRNSGNVFLEVALVTIMFDSIVTKKMEGNISRSERQWARALTWIAVSLLVGYCTARFWPVTAATQWTGWWWWAIALTGGMALFWAVTLIENGVFKDGEGPRFLALYGLGCGLLVLSYLGEYNRAGLVINSALTFLLYGRLIFSWLVKGRRVLV